MIRALLFVSLFLFVTCPLGIAAENDMTPETQITSTAIHNGDYTPQLLEKIKAERNTIYNSLNLTPEQIVKKDNIDVKRYKDLETPIQKLCLNRKKLKDSQTTNNTADKALKSINKEIENARHEIKQISNKYDKEFKKILNSEQKSKYNMIKKLKRADLKKLQQKDKKESDLKPFGVPISQAEYTEQQKKKKGFCGKFRRKD